jgi:serine acetyltransferase
VASHPASRGIWRLLWSDYEEHYRYKAERRWKAAVMLAPRVLSNASLHANLLVRLTTSGPRRSARLFAHLLRVAHGCDFSPDAEIGSALRMNHPIGITVGPRVRIGDGVALFQGATLDAGGQGWLTVGDRVEVFTGAFVGGAVSLGAASVVGANATLTHDLAPGAVFTFASPTRGGR